MIQSGSAALAIMGTGNTNQEGASATLFTGEKWPGKQKRFPGLMSE